MSEEDLIKDKLAKLFSDALLSDAATDTRSKFSERVAREFLEKISEDLEKHQTGLREERLQLAELARRMASERAELGSVVDRLAAAPMPAAGTADFGDMRPNGFGDDENPNVGPVRKAGRGGGIVPNFGKPDDADQASSSASPDEQDKRRFAYLVDAPVAYKIWMGIVALVICILIAVVVFLKNAEREPEVSTATEDLKQICASFSVYRNETRAAPASGAQGTGAPPDGTRTSGQGTQVQDAVGRPANPFATVEYVLADKCRLAGASGQTVAANPGGAPATAATNSGEPPSGAGNARSGN